MLKIAIDAAIYIQHFVHWEKGLREMTIRGLDGFDRLTEMAKLNPIINLYSEGMPGMITTFIDSQIKIYHQRRDRHYLE